MGLNIKNSEVEQLASEVAKITGESKTEAIRKALLERKDRLKPDDKHERRLAAMKWLRDEVWPTIKPGSPIKKADRERILGYGEDGV